MSEPDYKEMSEIGLQAAKNGSITVKFLNDLKFAKQPTLSEWFACGVQCGRTSYHTALFKQWISEYVYQRPYRHMWE